MLLKKSQFPILIVNVLAILIFSLLFIKQKNYEFIIYVGVIVFFLLLILFTNSRVNYPNSILWGLTLWAVLHMSGGGLYPGGTRLYEIILIPISTAYEVFKYDQFVHIIGFGVATLAMYAVLKPKLKPIHGKWVALGIIIVMAGLGVGALNEMLEFLATILAPETGVGGYVNTSLDIVADLIGALLAFAYIRLRKGEI
ncbi:MAG: DUF2238 domain-containing protein [Nanoarchaeota archaeon]